MKYFKFLIVISILLLASCSTYTGVYSDDLYYTPGGDNTIIIKHNKSDKSQKSTAVIMQIEDNDTTLTYVNDYEINYSNRIKTFYSPYMYDPFWDPYWSIDYGFNFRFGFGYSSYPFYYPYSWGYSNFYDPWYNNNYNNWYVGGYEYHGYNHQKQKNKNDKYYDHQKPKHNDYNHGGNSDAVRYERKNDKNNKYNNQKIQSNSSTRNYLPTYTTPRSNISSSYNGATRQPINEQKSTRVQSSMDSRSSILSRNGYKSGGYQRSIDSRSSTPSRNYSQPQSTRNFSPSNNSSNNFSTPSRSYSVPSPSYNNSVGGNFGGHVGNSGGSSGTRSGR